MSTSPSLVGHQQVIIRVFAVFFFSTLSNLADTTHLLQGSDIGHDRPFLPPSPNYFKAILIMSFDPVEFPHSSSPGQFCPHCCLIILIHIFRSLIAAAMISYTAQWLGQHAGLGPNPPHPLPVTEATPYTGSYGVADVELPNLQPDQCIYCEWFVSLVHMHTVLF